MSDNERRSTSMDHKVLTSWKEVASYLGKGVRTLQRWETNLGLPVHRPGNKRGVILVVTEELDEWVRKQGFLFHDGSTPRQRSRPAQLNAKYERMIAENEALRNKLKEHLDRTKELVESYRLLRADYPRSFPMPSKKKAASEAVST